MKEQIHRTWFWALPTVALLSLLLPEKIKSLESCDFHVTTHAFDTHDYDSALTLYAHPTRENLVVRAEPSHASQPTFLLNDGYVPIELQSPVIARDGTRWFELSTGGWVPTQLVRLQLGQEASVVQECQNLEVVDYAAYPPIDLPAYYVENNFSWPALPTTRNNPNLYYLRFPEDVPQSVHVFAAHKYTPAGAMIRQLYDQSGYVSLTLFNETAIYQASPYGRFENRYADILTQTESLLLLKTTDLDDRYAVYVQLIPLGS